MSSTNLAAQPTPEHLTLLFKCSKSTTLLSVLPDQDLTQVKAMLLAALKARNLETFPGSSVPLPSKADDLELGRLVDRRDASKGWVSLDARDAEAIEEKANKKAGANKTQDTNTPSSAGLSDGSWIAYRMRRSDAGEDNEVPDIEMDDDTWDVVLPSFDDEAADADD